MSRGASSCARARCLLRNVLGQPAAALRSLLRRVTLDKSLVVLLMPLALGASLPSNPALSLTSDSITVLDAGGRIVSTATVCPGFTFSQLGKTGPKVSPDRHWILVDVLGPYEPGNVGRNHALIQIATGRFVTSPDFKTYIGVPATLQPLEWASGQRATLRYANGTTAAVHDPPPHPLPGQRCPVATPR